MAPGGRVRVREMVDTHVLSYAVHKLAPGTQRDYAEKFGAMKQASVVLLNRMPEIRISAVAWAELLRTLTAGEAKKLEAYRRSIFVEALDGRISERAADLLRRYRALQTTCPRCLSSKASKQCEICGNQVSKHQRMNDALILATADVLEDVDVLYTFDGGMIEWGRHVTGCRVEKPPDPSGPLFEKVKPE